METPSGTRLYFRGKPLLFRRKLSEDELAHISSRIRRGSTAYRWLTLGAALFFFLVFAVVWVLAEDPIQAVFAATMFTLVCFGFATLFVRDVVLSALRLKRLPPDAEVLGFGSGRAHGEDLILHPPGLTLRIDDHPAPLAEVVKLNHVAPPSEMSLSVADWMTSEGQNRGNRILDDGEKAELERLLEKAKPKFRWLDAVLAAYITFVLYREFTVEHGEPAVTGVLIVLSLGWLAMTGRLYWRMRMGHAMVLRSIERNAVRLVLRDEQEAPARVVEYLLPDGLPWAADGEPAHWRTF